MFQLRKESKRFVTEQTLIIHVNNNFKNNLIRNLFLNYKLEFK